MIININTVSNNLTPREKEIMGLVAAGLTLKQIAAKLFISPGTVKKHMDNIYAKLEVNNKIEALNKLNKYV